MCMACSFMNKHAVKGSSERLGCHLKVMLCVLLLWSTTTQAFAVEQRGEAIEEIADLAEAEWMDGAPNRALHTLDPGTSRLSGRRQAAKITSRHSCHGVPSSPGSRRSLRRDPQDEPGGLGDTLGQVERVAPVGATRAGHRRISTDRATGCEESHRGPPAGAGTPKSRSPGGIPGVVYKSRGHDSGHAGVAVGARPGPA